MRKQLFIVIIMLLTQMSIFAQLSGTKTIGGSAADYSTISAAVTALSASGVNGAVIFNIASGTYTEQITINNISGASSTNTITFQSAANDSSMVTISYASSTTNANNFVVKLNAAKFIRFKELTIERTGTSSYATVVEAVGVSNNNKFENCIIKNGSSAYTSNFTSLVYITNGGSNNTSNYSFTNNKFENGSFGIYYLGVSSATLSAGNIISNNIFQNQGRTAIRLYYHDAPTINSNIITSSASYYDFAAIEAQYCKNGILIQNNKIAIAKKYGIRMNNSTGQLLAGLISNNFISLSGSGAIALYYSNSGSHNIYYNSINVYGSNATGMYVNGSQSNNLRFQNNIVKVGASGKCMDIISANFPFLNSNYNDYYFPNGNMGTWGATTNIATLALWKTTTNLDYSSINFDPSYNSNTDLHIVAPSSLSHKGTGALTTPSVNVDIDGNSRNNITPDIGAHEFTTEDLSISEIISQSEYCSGENEIIKFKLYNNGNSIFSGNIDASYKLGNESAVTQTFSITGLSAGSFVELSFTTALQFHYANSSNLVVKHIYADADATNNSLTKSISVNQSPVINWQNDTLVCSVNSIILDAGAGMTSYLWSTGATTQTITVDSSGIGLGAKYFKVDVSLNTCSASDSILVNFIYCTGINNTLNEKELNIYPNPTNGVIYIESNNINIEGANIKVYSSVNQIVYNAILTENKINLSELQSGYYFIMIETEKGILTKPIIIN